MGRVCHVSNGYRLVRGEDCPRHRRRELHREPPRRGAVGGRARGRDVGSGFSDDLNANRRGEQGWLSTVWIDHRLGSSRGHAQSAGAGINKPSHAWNGIPEADRERIRSRHGTYVQQMQLQHARDDEVTRVEAAGEGIVSGAHLKQHGGPHIERVSVVEPHTEETEIVDYYAPRFDQYLSEWSFNRPGEGWGRPSNRRRSSSTASGCGQ